MTPRLAALVFAGLIGFASALAVGVVSSVRAGTADNYFLNGSDAMRFAVTKANASSADTTEGWLNSAIYDERDSTWTRQTLSDTRVAGRQNLANGRQTITTTCAEVPTAGGSTLRSGISIQVIGGTTAVRCGFNSDCSNTQFSIDPGQLLDLPFVSRTYCDTASGSATAGRVEYK